MIEEIKEEKLSNEENKLPSFIDTMNILDIKLFCERYGLYLVVENGYFECFRNNLVEGV